MAKDVLLRAVTPRDEAFLLRLYGSTRPEVARFGWDEAEQAAFLRMQFDMQTRSYAAQYPGAEHSKIAYQGRDAGRVILDRSTSDILLVDIAVLPEFRGQGIATTVIRRLQQEASRVRRDIVLTVERTNSRAFQLYRKLGFEIDGEGQVHLSMRWDG